MTKRLPDFLVIGAMKSGTTTLCSDLCLNGSITFGGDKEPMGLATNSALGWMGRLNYRLNYRDVDPSQRCGDGSTCYSMLPDFEGVPERAKRILGNQIQIIYIVREPIARILSHHRWALVLGESANHDPNTDVLNRPQYVSYSSYAMQIKPWIELFGRERVLILRFEDYVQERETQLRRCLKFLGIEKEPSHIDEGLAHNRFDEGHVPGGLGGRFGRNIFYRRWLRPLFPQWFRDIFRKASVVRDLHQLRLEVAVANELHERLAPDMEEFARLSGISWPRVSDNTRLA